MSVIIFFIGLMSLNAFADGKSVVVAVIDTGADLEHKSLRDHLWVNEGETGKDASGRDKATNGVDDDGNGYADDVHGWDFTDQSNDLGDSHGHGTHIAGVIAKNGSQQVKLMILKYFDAQASPQDNLNSTIEAIRYAVKMKADIINYSSSGRARSDEEKRVIAEAGRAGILFVAAAGNEMSNADGNFFPGSYQLDNILNVAAHDSLGQLLPLSNFGSYSVHLAAPGKNIYGSMPGGGFGLMSGTSQAAAMATGAVTRILATEPRLEPRFYVQRLVATVDSDSELKGKTLSEGKLNVNRAVQSRDDRVTATGRRTGPLPDRLFQLDP